MVEDEPGEVAGPHKFMIIGETTMKSSMQFACVGVLAIVIVGVGLGVFYISTTNSLVISKVNLDTAKADIFVQYERKYDLIPQLIEVVENYTTYENATIALITQLRTQWLEVLANQSIPAAQNVTDSLDIAVTTLLANVEAYPLLQADTLFIGLFDEITGTENRITNAKLDYNQAVQNFNIQVLTFPGNLFASGLGFTPQPYWGNPS